MKLIDTSAWFDYFAGENKANAVEEIISKNEAVASAITIAEMKLKLVKTNREWRQAIGFIERSARILPLDQETALLAGEFKNLHTTDAMIYATARKNNMTLVTCDKDFRGMPGTKLLE